jgi:hypothetical protein
MPGEYCLETEADKSRFKIEKIDEACDSIDSKPKSIFVTKV